MSHMLLTGPPQSGKSTLIKKFVHEIDKPCIGFWTEEMREKGHRVGFEVHSLHGQKDVFAHVDFTSDLHIGKYAIILSRFEEIALPAIRPEDMNHIVIIDEIGKMECLSEVFCRQLVALLDSHQTVIATIAQYGPPFIETIKTRPDVQLLEMDAHHPDVLLQTLITGV